MNDSFILRLQRKERGAYLKLYDEYFKRLHHFAVNYVFDPETANDIVQSVFIKFYENIHTQKKDLNIGGYLSIMVRNSCLNYLRDRGVEDRHKILYLQASEKSETLSWLEDEELIQKIQSVISSLPERYRMICELRFYENLKYSEIATRLNITENVAKVQVHRAIQKIKDSLGNTHHALFGLLLFYEMF